MRGKKIGVIGTGSSGIQVTPILAEQAESLVVFQRSPNYTIPMPNHPWTDEDLQRIRREYPERRQRSSYAPSGTPHGTYHQNALDTDPAERDEAMWARWRDGGVLFSKTFPDQGSVLAANDIARRFAEDRIRDIVDDPAVAEDLIPTDHPIGTKRICTDAGYYATFNRDNVRLVNLRREPIQAITTDGVRTAEETYECDVLVFATGFDALTGAMTRIDPTGPDGHRLSEMWADGPVTFLGVMVPRLPNLFSFSGPGSPSVLANMVLHAEVQVDWAVGLMVAANNQGITEVEPRRDAAKAWTKHVAEAPSGRCSREPNRRGIWDPTSTARSAYSCHTSAASATTGNRWTMLRPKAIRGWYSPRDELQERGQQRHRQPSAAEGGAGRLSDQRRAAPAGGEHHHADRVRAQGGGGSDGRARDARQQTRWHGDALCGHRGAGRAGDVAALRERAADCIRPSIPMRTSGIRRSRTGSRRSALR